MKNISKEIYYDFDEKQGLIRTLKKRKKEIILFLITLICLAAAYLIILAINDSNSQIVYSKIQQFNDTDTDYTNDEYYIKVEQSKSWLEEETEMTGAQYDFTIVNNTDIQLYNWLVQIQLNEDDCRLDSYWNGTYEFENNMISIQAPLDYNREIEPNNEITYGYVLYSKQDYAIENIKLSYSLKRDVKSTIPYYIDMIAIVIWLISFISYIAFNIRMSVYNKQQKYYKNIMGQVMNTFANFVDAKDPYTKGHSKRVAMYSFEIAKEIGLEPKICRDIYYIALLHDVGKVGISDNVLKKQGKLTDEERAHIMTHTVIGGDMLVNFKEIDNIREGVMYHHERYDGMGYPEGLRGENIPFIARIIGIADAYDAMSSDRCYRKHLSQEKIISELEENAGKQFDPDIVVYMTRLIKSKKAQRISKYN